MLSNQHRLQKTKDVQNTFARGRAFFSPYFLGKFKKSAEAGKRFTVVVSTKVSKKAVDRNRIKRIVREQIRLHMDHFDAGDYVFTAKPKIMEVYDGKIADEFLKFVKSSKLLK